MLGKRLVTHQTGPKDKLISRLYAEEATSIAAEFYLSLVLDRCSERIMIMASAAGGVEILQPPSEIPQTIKGWEINPEMLYQQLLELKNRYGNLPVYITESGCAAPDELDSEGQVSDPQRVAYFRDYLRAAARAIEDGVNLKGYFAWSLMDNFEWAEGYSQRFGIVYVDFQSQKRIPKDSFYYLKNIFTRY